MRAWPRQTARPGRGRRGRAHPRAGQVWNNLVWNHLVRSVLVRNVLGRNGLGLLSRRPPKVTALHKLSPRTNPLLTSGPSGEPN
jgi:hypothetical protein